MSSTASMGHVTIVIIMSGSNARNVAGKVALNISTAFIVTTVLKKLIRNRGRHEHKFEIKGKGKFGF